MKISTSVTRLLGIQHPVIMGGMTGVGTPELAAAVSNAGGLGKAAHFSFSSIFLSITIRYHCNPQCWHSAAGQRMDCADEDVDQQAMGVMRFFLKSLFLPQPTILSAEQT